MHVRQLFGYYRFDTPKIVSLMNDVYTNELSSLQNYFYPVMKIKEKIRIQSKVKKIYDKPKTPYQRLMESTHLTETEKEKITAVFNS